MEVVRALDASIVVVLVYPTRLDVVVVEAAAEE